MIAKINIRPDRESPATETIERTVPAFWPIPQIGTDIVISLTQNDVSIVLAEVTDVSIFYNDNLEPAFVEIEAS